jgi:hypothetical protein
MLNLTRRHAGLVAAHRLRPRLQCQFAPKSTAVPLYFQDSSCALPWYGACGAQHSSTCSPRTKPRGVLAPRVAHNKRIVRLFRNRSMELLSAALNGCHQSQRSGSVCWPSHTGTRHRYLGITPSSLSRPHSDICLGITTFRNRQFRHVVRRAWPGATAS